MKWELTKKNRWTREKQKQPEVREVSPVDWCDRVDVYGGKDFRKRYVFSLEWRSKLWRMMTVEIEKRMKVKKID